MNVLFWVSFFIVNVNCDYKITLEEVSSVFLPSSSSHRIWDVDAVESASYDAVNKYLYVVGGLYRTIIDAKNPKNLAPVGSYQSTQGNLELTDISVCGNYFIQTTDNTGQRQRGTVEIFKKFDFNVGPERLFSAEVGECPSSVKFLPDCMTAIVVVNGCAHGIASSFVDPMAKILLVQLPDRPTTGGFADNVRITTLNFTEFDNRVDELTQGGARFVYRRNNNSFSNDVDPYKLALSKDGKKAYIGLQRTNAVAVVDLETSTIVNVLGLGLKEWRNLKMDASDRDGGINLKNWPVYSYYLPDGIQYMSHGGREYIVTANEGDEYDYEDLISWTEVKRGRELVENNMTSDSLSDHMKSCLANDSMLGRLKFTTENGANNSGGYSQFVMFGSRSFTIWDANTMKLVYDSGDDIATRHAAMYPDLFNNPVNGSNIIKDNADQESADKGPEPESIEVGSIDRLSLIFVGNESPGTICVYSILDDVKKPRFEYLWQSVQNTSQTWEQQFLSQGIKGINPEKIIFLPKEQSPTKKPAIFVIASESASVTLLNVVLSGTLPPASTGTETPVNFVMLLVMVFMQLLARVS